MIIPYDHAAAFELTGRPGNIVQDVINVGSDGVFVAVAIGYGFEEQRARPIDLPAGLPATTLLSPASVTLAQLSLAPLIEGFRINPEFASLVFVDRTRLPAPPPGQVFANQPLAADFLFARVIERVKTPEDISFFFSIVDSDTGREFQDQPAHNLASLGKSNGERPFRLLARPLTFMPRSTLRLQISERTEGTRGTLFIVLYGYKILGEGCAEPVMRNWRATPHGCPVETIGDPEARAILFDYVTTFELTGRPGNLIEDEISVNAGDGFIATSIGYGLAADARDVSVTLPAAGPPPPPTVNLGNLRLDAFSANALLDGIRLRPNFLRTALEPNGRLATALPVSLVNQIFERINRPEDVSFRYEIFDSGAGRELQNRAINNIAGLGIANGDRPFKKLARQMSFLPRSTIRVRVEEQFGRGTLFIAFRGYKLVGAARGGGRR